MNQPIRYGMVGMGGFGGTRRKTLRNAGGFEMLGGVDTLPSTFDAAEKEEGKPLQRYPSVEALAADPRMEAIFISTPAHLHVAQAMLAAKAGKAIFVEKPLGHDLAACLELVEYCEKNQIPHGHGFNSRYKPLWQYVKQILVAGKLGRVVSVSAATMHTGGLAMSTDNWRFLGDKNPGGPLFQCGIHEIDNLRFLFGEGQWLTGYVNRTVTKSSTDDAYVLIGTFGGIPTTLHSHYVTCLRGAMEIYGTDGDLLISEYLPPLQLVHTMTNLSVGTQRESVHDITTHIPPSQAEVEALRDFAAAVRQRRQPKMNGREGLKSLELVFQATRVVKEIR